MFGLEVAMRLCYQADVRLVGFRFQLKVSRVSIYTEELLYTETFCLWMTIYISRIFDTELLTRVDMP